MTATSPGANKLKVNIWYILLQVGGVELDLSLLLQTIQKFGGINVIERKGKWGKVAEALRLNQKAVSWHLCTNEPV